jgi:hypothetical protein
MLSAWEEESSTTGSRNDVDTTDHGPGLRRHRHLDRRLHPRAAHVLRRDGSPRRGRAREPVAQGPRFLRHPRFAHRGVPRPHGERHRDRRPRARERAHHDLLLRLRGAAEDPAAVRARRGHRAGARGVRRPGGAFSGVPRDALGGARRRRPDGRVVRLRRARVSLRRRPDAAAPVGRPQGARRCARLPVGAQRHEPRRAARPAVLPG